MIEQPPKKTTRRNESGRSSGAAADGSLTADYLTLDGCRDGEQALRAATVPDELHSARQSVVAAPAGDRDDAQTQRRRPRWRSRKREALSRGSRTSTQGDTVEAGTIR